MKIKTENRKVDGIYILAFDILLTRKMLRIDLGMLNRLMSLTIEL